MREDDFDIEEDDTGPAGWDDPFLPGACLMAGKTLQCPFLSSNACTIYPTRPNECVGFMAGSPKCQDTRRMENLEPLKAKEDQK